MPNQESDIHVCPSCGSELEKGIFSFKIISWGHKKIGNWRPLRGLFAGDIVISGGYPYLIQNVEAHRCQKCELIVFKYGDFAH